MVTVSWLDGLFPVHTTSTVGSASVSVSESESESRGVVEGLEAGSEVEGRLDASVEAARAKDVQPPKERSGTRGGFAGHVRGFGRVGWGVTPRFDVGGGLALGLTWRRVRAEAFGGAVAPTEEPIELLPGAVARVFGWSVGVRGCGIAWAGPDARETVTLPICAALEAGQIIGRGDGTGLQDADTYRGPWVGARVGPAVVVKLARVLSLVADVELLTAFARPGFTVRGADEVYRLRPAGVSATIGIELHFPRRISGAGGIR